MMFDTNTLTFLRNPWGDESLVDIVRAATICDEEGRLESLMRSADITEMKVDLLSPADDLFGHMMRYNPNLLIMPTELLGEDFFAELTLRLTEQPIEMPFLVNVGTHSDKPINQLTECYKKCLQIEWIDTDTSCEKLHRFVSQEIMTLNELTARLRQCAALTLRSMHIESGDAFDYLLDEITEVLQNSFVFFHSINELHYLVAKRRNTEPGTIIETIDSATELAMTSMTNEEFVQCFYWYVQHDKEPATAEFIFTAARITSFYCSKLIHHIQLLQISRKTLIRRKK